MSEKRYASYISRKFVISHKEVKSPLCIHRFHFHVLIFDSDFYILTAPGAKYFTDSNVFVFKLKTNFLQETFLNNCVCLYISLLSIDVCRCYAKVFHSVRVFIKCIHFLTFCKYSQDEI